MEIDFTARCVWTVDISDKNNEYIETRARCLREC